MNSAEKQIAFFLVLISIGLETYSKTKKTLVYDRIIDTENQLYEEQWIFKFLNNYLFVNTHLS